MPLSQLSSEEDDIVFTTVTSVANKLGRYTRRKHDFDVSGRIYSGLSLPAFLLRIHWTLDHLDVVALDKEAEEDYETLATKVLDAISSGDPSSLLEAAEFGVEICRKYDTPPASGGVPSIPTVAAFEALSMLSTYRALEEHENFDDPDVWLKAVRDHGEAIVDYGSSLVRAIHSHRMRRLAQREVDAIAESAKRLADGIKATKLNSSTIMVEVGDDGTVLTIQGVGPEFDEILRKDHYDLIEKKKETVRAAKEALKELESIL